jgi:putative component of membrane protein insertase Oxa1/YidC/SpoIIIJ protein YidD
VNKLNKIKKYLNVVIFFSFLNAFNSHLIGQNRVDFNDKVIKYTFSEYSTISKSKRKLLSVKEKSQKYNPLFYFAASGMFIYQNLFSEQISANCSYEISCSEYTKRSIEKFGLIKGVFFGLHQLSSCIPGVQEQHAEYMISVNNKIINEVK